LCKNSFRTPKDKRSDYFRALVRLAVRVYQLPERENNDDEGTFFSFLVLAIIVSVVLAVIYTGKLLELLGG